VQIKEFSLLSKLFSELPYPKFGLIGHRGLAGRAPENTLASFREAAKLGLNWVEFDVQCCASGEWVLFHDATLKRTTNGDGLVAEIPYKTLQTLDAGSWFDPRFQNEPVPLFSEALTLLAQLGLYPNIEIKANFSEKSLRMQDFLSQIHRHWPAPLSPPLVSSFDSELLAILRSLSPQIPLGYLTHDFSEEAVSLVLTQQFDTLHCQDTFTNLEPLQWAQKQGVPLLVYTVNDPKRIQQLLEAGATAVFSDITNEIFLLKD